MNGSLLQLRNAPVLLSLEELTILEDIQKVLGCFEEATKKFKVILLKIISIMDITFFSVRTRLFPYETRSVARLDTILDASFKKEGFRSVENAARAATLLEQKMFSMMKKIDEESKQHDSLAVTETSSEEPKQSTTLFGFLSDRSKAKEKSIIADVIITKRQYLERPNSNANVEPLLFWKVAGEDLKPMDHVARKFFCIPATSAESERVFSLTGQLIEQRRSRFNQKKSP
ncbi:hypothetical protein JTB14_010459 [Gonioctena quinquepunctata]|nr:hypothetical protein JTB14_010459 [Gonioctena quinquepunctata]